MPHILDTLKAIINLLMFIAQYVHARKTEPLIWSIMIYFREQVSDGDFDNPGTYLQCRED